MNHYFINGKTFEECRIAMREMNRAKNDSLTVCEEIPNEKLFVYAKGNEIKIPKLNNQKEIEDMEQPNSFLEAVEKAIKQLDSRELKQVQEISEEVLKARFEEKKANEERHLNHHFYTRADDYRELERRNQILKGAAKYPTPFEPMEWTPKQLLQHAMQENVDQAHYIYGLYEWIEEMQKEMEHQKSRAEAYSEMLKDVGRLTKFLVEEFPEAGNAGDLSVDVAIELLKNYRKFESVVAEQTTEQRERNAAAMAEHNSLATYLNVYYPQMVVEGETAIMIAKRVMDAYRKDEDLHAKG